MYEPRIMQFLEKAANADMRLARKEGRIMIATRNKGRAYLSYTDRVYKLVDRKTGDVLYEGKAKGCRETLIGLYEVIA